MKLNFINESIADAQSLKMAAQRLGLPTTPEYLSQLWQGIGVEREHNKGKLDVVNNDLDLVKIAAAHLKELPDYYTKLKEMEGSAVSEELRMSKNLRKDDSPQAGDKYRSDNGEYTITAVMPDRIQWTRGAAIRGVWSMDRFRDYIANGQLRKVGCTVCGDDRKSDGWECPGCGSV